MDGSYHIDTALRGYVQPHRQPSPGPGNAVTGDIREVYGEAKDAGFNITVTSITTGRLVSKWGRYRILPTSAPRP